MVAMPEIVGRIPEKAPQSDLTEHHQKQGNIIQSVNYPHLNNKFSIIQPCSGNILRE